MIVVLDSSPGVMRTWYAYHLAKRLGFEQRHVCYYTQILDATKHDTTTGRDVVWDGSWLSMHREYRMSRFWNMEFKTRHWDNEWRYGRAVQTAGIRIMLTIQDEAAGQYARYAEDYGWTVVPVDDEQKPDVLTTLYDLVHQTGENGDPRLKVPGYVGPIDPKTVVVGEALNPTRENWIPFSSNLTRRYGLIAGSRAFTLGWTNIGEVPADFLENRFAIIACGKKAEAWIDKLNLHVKNYLRVPHPAWLYRFNTPDMVEKRDRVEQLFKYFYEGEPEQ